MTPPPLPLRVDNCGVMSVRFSPLFSVSNSRMLTPFTYFGFLWLTYGLHKLLALLQHCVDPKEKWRTSVRHLSLGFLFHPLTVSASNSKCPLSQTNKAYRFWGKIMSWSRVEFYIRTTLLLVIGILMCHLHSVYGLLYWCCFFPVSKLSERTP